MVGWSPSDVKTVSQEMANLPGWDRYARVKSWGIALFMHLVIADASEMGVATVSSHLLFHGVNSPYLQGKRGIEKPPFNLPDFIKV